MRLDPGNPLANYDLAGIEAGSGRYASARSRLRPAAKRSGKAMREIVQRSMHNLDRAEAKAANEKSKPS